MGNLITEVYVSIDGIEFTKLDLHSDESIPMRYTTKDLQDISKIFSPYSLSFTFPTSEKNRAAFGFFGDTDVIKINTENRFPTKIYTDGVLNLQGFILLEDRQERNSTPTDFTGNFSTSMTNLADRIGDDLIGDLTDSDVEIDWSPKNVYDLVKGANNINVDGVNVSYFVPLISSNRVWAFDSNLEGPLKDNVAYDSSVDPNSTGTIKSDELRPCIGFNSIIELIKLKYNLDVEAPLDLRKEYTELMIWCNSETMLDPKDKLVTLKTVFGPLFSFDTKNESGIPDPKKYTQTASLLNSSFKVTKRPSPFQNEANYTEFFTHRIRFEGVLITGNTDSPTVNIKIKRKDTGEVLISNQFDIVGNSVECDVQISDDFFIGDDVEYQIFAQFNQATTWTNTFFRIFFKYYDGKTGFFSSKEFATYAFDSTPNNNSADVGGTIIDLFKSLPEMKVIDFLTSYFKMFNISVFDTSPNDDKLFWLTPSDIQTNGLSFSKATLDYTPYVDSTELKKSTSTDFNFYNFKHATSEYRSNIDFLEAIKLEYGQAKFPEIIPANPVEFVVETDFTLMVPVLLIGTSDVITYYGFDGDPPEITETGESRYTPNYGELTIFYNAGNTTIGTAFRPPLIDSSGFVLGFLSTDVNGVVVNSPIESYMKVLPFNTESNSLAFSIIKEQGVEFPESLYKRYYQAQTERLLDPNVLSQDFDIDLPSEEIYLNEATTIQGQGETPKGFRLQNDIIVGENLFTILDATIDVTTGKGKITLLNF